MLYIYTKFILRPKNYSHNLLKFKYNFIILLKLYFIKNQKIGHIDFPPLEPQEIDEGNNTSNSGTLKEKKNEKALKNVLEKASEDA